MPKYQCVRECQWRNRFWYVGEMVNTEEQPCRHFEEIDNAGRARKAPQEIQKTGRTKEKKLITKNKEYLVTYVRERFGKVYSVDKDGNVTIKRQEILSDIKKLEKERGSNNES